MTKRYPRPRTVWIYRGLEGSIYVITEGRRCLMELAQPGETLTEAVFPLRGDEGYLRVDCRDARGCHAYSNAYFLDVL